jgi:hypothetical protein
MLDIIKENVTERILLSFREELNDMRQYDQTYGVAEYERVPFSESRSLDGLEN